MSSRGYIDRAIRHVLEAESHALGAEQDASRPGLLQQLDPRVKVVCAMLFIITAAATHSVAGVASLFLIVTALALLSSLSLGSIALRVWLPMLLFTIVIASPSLFTTPGRSLAALPLVGWTVTEQGLRTASMLFARVMTASTIAYVLVVSTTWPRLLAALRRLRVPAAIVVLISMTYRYIFLLATTAHDMLLSRRSRLVGRLTPLMQRTTTSAMAGTLMLRSIQLGNDVHLAMRSRGFHGSFDSLDTFRARFRDLAALAIVFAIATVLIWRGR